MIFNKACRDLPPGYIITVNLENGCGWIEISTPIENNIMDWYEDDKTFIEQIDSAIEWCKKDAEMTGGGE